MRPETPLTPSKGWCVACEREFWRMSRGDSLCERCAPVTTDTLPVKPDGWWAGWLSGIRAEHARTIAEEVEARCHALGHASPCWQCSPIIDIIRTHT